MSKCSSIKLLLRKGILLIFLYFYCTCIFENALSARHWDRENIQVNYNKSERSINISVVYFDYEFGPRGEHGYLKLCEICFSINEESHQKLFICEVDDQIKQKQTWLKLRSKLLLTKINIFKGGVPDSNIRWDDHTSFTIWCTNVSNKACFGIKWFLQPDQNFKEIIVKGQWNVNGLNCNDQINERYLIKEGESMKTDSKNENLNAPTLYKTENTVNVYTEADAIVVKGATPSENLKVYNTLGAEVKSLVTNSDVVTIKLPANQIYLVNIGQARYKVAL